MAPINWINLFIIGLSWAWLDAILIAGRTTPPPPSSCSFKYLSDLFFFFATVSPSYFALSFFPPVGFNELTWRRHINPFALSWVLHLTAFIMRLYSYLQNVNANAAALAPSPSCRLRQQPLSLITFSKCKRSVRGRSGQGRRGARLALLISSIYKYTHTHTHSESCSVRVSGIN